MSTFIDMWYTYIQQIDHWPSILFYIIGFQCIGNIVADKESQSYEV